MTAPNDPRAVVEYRVPASSLEIGDLVNTAPGEGDWQQVIGVWADGSTAGAPGNIGTLVQVVGSRYVVVTMTDISAIDGGVFFDGDTAMIAGDDLDGGDQPVADSVGTDADERTYLYTQFEVVTVRAR